MIRYLLLVATLMLTACGGDGGDNQDTSTPSAIVGDGSGGAGDNQDTSTPSAIVGDAYVFHSEHDDSYFMEFWGDVWDSKTTYTDQTSDSTYSKTLEIGKSTGWGTLVAWGNRPINGVDASAYTHARFKVRAPGYTQVQVFALGIIRSIMMWYITSLVRRI